MTRGLHWCTRCAWLVSALSLCALLLLATVARAEVPLPTLPVVVDVSKVPVGSWAEYQLYDGDTPKDSKHTTTVRWALVARDDKGAVLEATYSGGTELGPSHVMRIRIASDVSTKALRAPVSAVALQISSKDPVGLNTKALGMQQRLARPKSLAVTPKKAKTKTAAGTFETSLYRQKAQGGTLELWVSESAPPLGWVKMTFTPDKQSAKKGAQPVSAELVRSGSDAKPSIVKAPVKLTPAVMKRLLTPIASTPPAALKGPVSVQPKAATPKALPATEPAKKKTTTSNKRGAK